ncbi:unnamed protein product [Dibothriocephalus latus]|uniref:Peptidase S1 domain-containing protein n=1 Tax=Dibothriocephalus latus TaxID=60516 RepID=A0A3P6V0E8_DIBLA|nr:unnamed protein product [Dibothriocephalus latus]
MTAGETFNFANLTGDKLIAHLGDHTFTKPETTLQAIEVELIQVHPDFNDKDEGASVDVALLQLSKAITKSKDVDYICVPSADLGLSSEKSCYYAGWGAVLRQGTVKQWRNPRLLREAEVSVASNEECSKAGLSVTGGKTTCIEVEARDCVSALAMETQVEDYIASQRGKGVGS